MYTGIDKDGKIIDFTDFEKSPDLLKGLLPAKLNVVQVTMPPDSKLQRVIKTPDMPCNDNYRGLVYALGYPVRLIFNKMGFRIW